MRILRFDLLLECRQDGDESPYHNAKAECE